MAISSFSYTFQSIALHNIIPYCAKLHNSITQCAMLYIALACPTKHDNSFIHSAMYCIVFNLLHFTTILSIAPNERILQHALLQHYVQCNWLYCTALYSDAMLLRQIAHLNWLRHCHGYQLHRIALHCTDLPSAVLYMHYKWLIVHHCNAMSILLFIA